MLLAFVIGGWAGDSATLNSERIAQKFGSYRIEVIENKDNIRVTNLYSDGPEGAICRTFAVVGLVDQADPSFAAEHELVTDGGSIGAVFKNHGWKIDKDHRFIGDMRIGRQSTRVGGLMHIDLPATVAVHVYVLAISKSGLSFDYAMIAELHHPEYLTSSELRSIYGRDYSEAKNRRDILQVIALVKSKMQDPGI
jgi:hypothetical protein